MKIHPATLKVGQLFSTENERYVVPPYQRRYSWEIAHVEELARDVQLIKSGDSHLLGTIVCLTGPHTSGINDLELVDGQQRVTTIAILLICIKERLNALGLHAEATAIESLIHAAAHDVKPTLKIALDSLDASEFTRQASGATLEKPRNPRLAAAFGHLRKLASGMSEPTLRSFVFKLKNECFVIRLEVSDAKDAFKLFETINNRGLSLSPTDIIKNFVLGNAAQFGEHALAIAKAKWAELIQHLDGTSLDAFFRHYLCAKLKRRITVSFVIANFKMVFMTQVLEAKALPDRKFYTQERNVTDDPSVNVTGIPSGHEDLALLPSVTFAQFLEELISLAKTYGEIVQHSTTNKAVNRHLENLKWINALQTYGFLMALRFGGCDDKTFIAVLKLTEAFLLRRHTCRERANENETLFARLCSVDPKNPLPFVTSEYRKLSPTDQSFRQNFSETAFTSNLIDRARYCLEQFEYHAHGVGSELSVKGSSQVHVEHIIPQKIKSNKAKAAQGDWSEYLGDNAIDLHPQHVGRIGNLTLLAGALNQSASNGPYKTKRALYAESTLFTTKSVSATYEDFRFAEVVTRSDQLSELALMLWPMP